MTKSDFITPSSLSPLDIGSYEHMPEYDVPLSEQLLLQIGQQVMKHVLKTDSSIFQHSWNGAKPWEIRLNDRGFKKGDTYCLRETVYTGAEMAKGKPLEYTGRVIEGVIELVLNGPIYGLGPDWAILTVRQITSRQEGS